MQPRVQIMTNVPLLFEIFCDNHYLLPAYLQTVPNSAFWKLHNCIVHINKREIDRREFSKDCHLERWAVKQAEKTGHLFPLSLSLSLSVVPRSYNIHPWRFT